jgi:hypothetical protein
MRGSVLLLVARPFRTSLTPALEAVEHVGARRGPGPLEDLETTDRDTLKPVDGARTGGRQPVGDTRRGALHRHLLAVRQLHNVGADQGLITSARSGPVVML